MVETGGSEMIDKQSLEKITLFICPRCNQGSHEMPALWLEFWREHDSGPDRDPFWKDPHWMDKARAWFAARGEENALDKVMTCPACGCEEHLRKWITKGPAEAGKIFTKKE
jgi:predicted RNA-binding Zn-ribbon protein involved in translation (DUF1610 family)